MTGWPQLRASEGMSQLSVIQAPNLPKFCFKVTISTLVPLSSSLLHAVHLVGRGRDFGRRVPTKVDFGLLFDGVTVRVDFFIAGGLVFALCLRLLLEGALECVAVLEEPDALSLGLVVLEFAFKVHAVWVDPLARRQLGVTPFAAHFHARFLEQVGAVA